MNYFQYRSTKNPGQGITIGQRDDTTLFLKDASFLSEEENRFESIEQIEEFLDDELEMVIVKQ